MQNRLWFLFAARDYLSLNHVDIIRRRFDERVQQMSGSRFHALQPTTERVRLIEHVRSGKDEVLEIPTNMEMLGNLLFIEEAVIATADGQIRL